MDKFVYRKEGLKLTKPDEIVVEQREDIKELREELWLYKKAFDLMSLVLCTEARDDLKNQICRFTWREDVKNFFLKEAEKELKK